MESSGLRPPSLLDTRKVGGDGETQSSGPGLLHRTGVTDVGSGRESSLPFLSQFTICFPTTWEGHPDTLGGVLEKLSNKETTNYLDSRGSPN